MLYLLDTCSYLRLAYSINPLLGTNFYAVPEKAVVTPQVHVEWTRASRLRKKFHWAGDAPYVANRKQNLIAPDQAKSSQIKTMSSNIQAHSSASEVAIKANNCKIPSSTDCEVLAHAYVFSNSGVPTIAVSDDGGMGWVAGDLQIPFITTLDLVHRMVVAQKQTLGHVKALAGYLDYEKDLPPNWRRNGFTIFGIQLP